MMDGMNIKALAKLQVFIDQAVGSVPRSQPLINDPELSDRIEKSLAVLAAEDKKKLTTHFLRMAMNDTPEYRAIAASLRRTEAYSMVSFLLQEGEGEKLEALSARYGISAGHFRRLFRAALGSNPKSDLKDWRLAKAVLAVIERQQSVTEVAMAYGYASPSHFSNEVKKTLGLSLTNLFAVHE